MLEVRVEEHGDDMMNNDANQSNSGKKPRQGYMAAFLCSTSRE